MIVFSKTYTAPIILQKNPPKAILLAAQDLQRDLRRLSGKKRVGFPALGKQCQFLDERSHARKAQGHRPQQLLYRQGFRHSGNAQI